MNKTETKEKVLQAIRNMNSDELFSLCLEFSDVNDGCDLVYSMDEVDDIFCDVAPSKIMEITRNSPEFSPYDEYFYEDSFIDIGRDTSGFNHWRDSPHL